MSPLRTPFLFNSIGEPGAEPPRDIGAHTAEGMKAAVAADVVRVISLKRQVV